MKSNIDIILELANHETIIRLILEELQDHQIANIRNKINPHWADHQYGKWAYNDRLFKICFSEPFDLVISLLDLYDTPESHSVEHCRCLLCGEEVQADTSVFNEMHNHLFSKCIRSQQLMDKANCEEEYRIFVKEFIKKGLYAKL